MIDCNKRLELLLLRTGSIVVDRIADGEVLA